MADKEYVAVGPCCWGRDKYDAESALLNGIRSLSPSLLKDPNKATFTVFECEGDWEINDVDGSISAHKITAVARDINVDKRLRESVETLWDKLTMLVEDNAEVTA